MIIRYRPAGTDLWLLGDTLNVSDAGVLFRTPSQAPNPGETLEMTLQMSSLAPRIADVFCCGRVVRTGTSSGECTQIAATIDHYQLSRPRQIDP
jgi:hypothetical protein